MSVLIRGMKMPKDCDACQFSNINDCKLWMIMDVGEIHPECPLLELPEKHGDLIDRDTLVKDLTNGIKAGLLLDGYEKYPNINNMDDCVECVKYADVVIKAEGKQ